MQWTKEHIASQIIAGDILLVYRNQLIRIPPAWLDEHPGGSLAILHFVGRDATDEIDAYHSSDTLKRILRYAVGSIETDDHGWLPLLPPVMSGWVRKFGNDGKLVWSNEANSHPHRSQILLVEKRSLPSSPTSPTLAHLCPPPTNLSSKLQAQHSAAYKSLHKRILDAGLYKTPYLSGYGPELARYVLLGTFSGLAYYKNWLLTSAVFLGLMWHQLVFTAHDLGHMGVTHNWTIDRILGILIADFIGGLSIGWWVEVIVLLQSIGSGLIPPFQNHNIHHRTSSVLGFAIF